MIETRICIIGAGPAGASAALHLSRAGIECTVVDKARFPRDKVCGDGINGRIPELIRELDFDLYTRFVNETSIHIGTWGIRVQAYNSSILEVPFFAGYKIGMQASPGYICKRLDFDNFLVEEMKRKHNILFHEGKNIEVFEKLEDGFIVSTRGGDFKIKATLLIVANGSDSAFSRNFAGNRIHMRHTAAAIRGYFKNVTGFHHDHFVEFYFLNEVIPGYLWIFPQANGYANVGLGMRSDHISKKQVNLRKLLTGILASHPTLSKRFATAELVDGKLMGHSVPLGTRPRKISGQNFMLAGDAAGLVDPLTGGGIANSFLSGKLAAHQAMSCIASKDFTARSMKNYDRTVHKEIGSGLRISHLLQRFLQYSFLTKFLINFLCKHPRLFDRLSRLQMKMLSAFE
jgi:menaquinone-9 beta-reductase